jgi:hypothetical protein
MHAAASQEAMMKRASPYVVCSVMLLSTCAAQLQACSDASHAPDAHQAPANITSNCEPALYVTPLLRWWSADCVALDTLRLPAAS